MATRDHHRIYVSEIIAQLMWGPKTCKQLVQAIGSNRWTVDKWLHSFERSGVVYKRSRKRTPDDGSNREWVLNSVPFGHLVVNKSHVTPL